MEGASPALREGAARQVHEARLHGVRRRRDRLKARARLPEEIDLLGRAGTPEDRVAVGKAPEALDDVAMRERVGISVRGFREGAQRLNELAGAQLIRQRLAVLERQIDEQALHRQQLAVVCLRQRMARGLEGERVGGEGARRAAEHVARKLVEQHDERQAIAWRLLPAREPAGSRRFVRGKEAVAHLLVERLAFFEPARQPLAENAGPAKPKKQHFRRAGLVAHGADGKLQPAKTNNPGDPMIVKLRRIIASLLVLSIAGLGLPLPVQAGMVGTHAVVASAERERIASFLEREDVRQQLLAQGVSPTQAKARVAALTDEEARQLAGQVDSLPAGGDILGVLLTVFLVLLITDILGFTKIFPFTRPVR